MKHLKLSTCISCPYGNIFKVLKTPVLRFTCGLNNNLEITSLNQGEPLKIDIPAWCPLDDYMDFDSEIDRLNIRFKEETK